MENPILRVAGQEDAEQMLAIYAPYVRDTKISAEYEAPSCDEFCERIRQTQKRLPWLVYELDGKILGYGYASPHRIRAAYQWSAETSIYVRDGFQRQGIASKIYKALFALLTLQGYYNIFVGITAPNERSVSFHKAMGFEASGAYQNAMFKFGEWCDVHWMAKSLRTHDAHPKPTVAFPDICNSECVQDILIQCK